MHIQGVGQHYFVKDRSDKKINKFGARGIKPVII
jgi:hypothetical protein